MILSVNLTTSASRRRNEIPARREPAPCLRAHRKLIIDFTPHRPHAAGQTNPQRRPYSRRIRTLGKDDQLVEWFKPAQKPDARRISFVDALRRLKQASRGSDLPALVVNPHRPHRAEPRVRKRRPKEFPVMKKPRDQLRRELLTVGHEA